MSDDIIVLEDLSKIFSNGVEVRALDGVNLRIKAGEFVAIVGPSGSGKSTLLNMIGLLDTPSSGRIFLKGIDVSRASADERARLRNRELGFVFQYHHLIPEFSALENVMMPMLIAGKSKSEAKERSRELLFSWAWRTGWTTGLTSYPAARTSEWPWPALWLTALPSSSAMS